MKKFSKYIPVILIFIVPLLVGLGFWIYDIIKTDRDTYDYNEKITINDIKYRVMTEEETEDLEKKYDYNQGNVEGDMLPYHQMIRGYMHVLVPIDVPKDLKILTIENPKKSEDVWFYLPSIMFNNLEIEEIYIDALTIFSENFMNNSNVKKIVATEPFRVKTNSFNNCDLEEFKVDWLYKSDGSQYFDYQSLPNNSTVFEYNTFSNLKNLKEIDVLLLGNGAFNNCSFNDITYNGESIVRVDTDYLYYTDTYESDLYKQKKEEYGYPYCLYYIQNNMVFCPPKRSINDNADSMAVFVNDAENNKQIKLLEGQKISNNFILGNDFTFDLTKNDIHEIDEYGNLVENITMKNSDNQDVTLNFLIKALSNNYSSFDMSLYDGIMPFAFREVDIDELIINTGTLVYYVIFYNCEIHEAMIVDSISHLGYGKGPIDLIENNSDSLEVGDTNPYFPNKCVVECSYF